jgi:hypothetical protein
VEISIRRIGQADVEAHNGDLRRHPLIKVIADAASDMVRYAGEFTRHPPTSAEQV